MAGMIWARLARPRPDLVSRRSLDLGRAAAACGAVLLLRLLWMQAWQGAHYRSLAETNSVRTVPFRAPRGRILDRQLRPLVVNAPSLAVGLTPAELPRDAPAAERVMAEVAATLSLPLEAVRLKVERQRARPYAPARLAFDVDRALVARLEEARRHLPGLAIWQDSKRVYPQAGAAHVLGYLGEITDRQLSRLHDLGYRMGDLLGQAGVESEHDLLLKGQDGGRQVRINASGRELGVLSERAPEPGDDLVLTLDMRLQAAAEEALGRDAGAVVALDPRSGEVLALVSKPDFDPAVFAGRVRAADWRALQEDERHPMNNRAVQGLYPPGSVFKVVTALAGLEEKVITPETRYDCSGILWISNWPYRCWKEIGHGGIEIERAITESCDVFFYQLGRHLKVDALARWSRDLGLGERSGIDLPGEAAGLVPDPAWKQQTEGMPWFPGNTVMMSIGQGYLLATPLQLAVVVSALANGGNVVTPHLKKMLLRRDGSSVQEARPGPRQRLELDPEALHLIQRGMEGAVQSPRGTASRARVEGLSVAGKTGTSQNAGEDHAAFICFAPVENPTIAVAVLVENGGEGGLHAAPIARRMLEVYFK